MNVTLYTPTYAPDYQRFCLQRESIERCGIELPHVAVVHHEDLAQFRQVPHQRNLTIVSTRDVLPRRIERRRGATGYPRKNPLRYVMPFPLAGWMTQQIVKLAAPKIVSTAGIVCLDSDVVFVAPITDADFFDVSGRLHLYETETNIDAEMADWFCRSMRFLGVPMRQQPLRQYIHPLSPLHREVLLEMHAAIEARFGKPWHQAIVEQNVFEYMTHGVYSRFVNQLRRQVPVTPRLCVYYWWPEQAQRMEKDFLSRIQQAQARAVWIQSNLDQPVAKVRALAARAWDAAAASGVTPTLGH